NHPGFHFCSAPFIERPLEIIQFLSYRHITEGARFIINTYFSFFTTDPVDQDGCILGNVTRTDFHAEGHASQLPVGEFVTGTEAVAVIDLYTQGLTVICLPAQADC